MNRTVTCDSVKHHANYGSQRIEVTVFTQYSESDVRPRTLQKDQMRTRTVTAILGIAAVFLISF